MTDVECGARGASEQTDLRSARSLVEEDVRLPQSARQLKNLRANKSHSQRQSHVCLYRLLPTDYRPLASRHFYFPLSTFSFLLLPLTAFDILITLVPALATLAFTAGVLRAAVTMAPPAWSYWMAVVFAACCLLLPLRYGPGFIPDDTALLGSPRAFVLDLLLLGSFTAVAVGLSLRALRVREKPARLAWLLLLASVAVCFFILCFESIQI